MSQSQLEVWWQAAFGALVEGGPAAAVLRAELPTLLRDVYLIASEDQARAFLERLAAVFTRAGLPHPGPVQVPVFLGPNRGLGDWIGRGDFRQKVQGFLNTALTVAPNPPADKTFTVYPELVAPAEVARGQVFRVEVRVRAQPGPRTPVGIALDDGADGLEVELVVPPQVEALSGLEGQLRVVRDQNSPWLIFELSAQAEGQFLLVAKVRYQGRTVAELPAQVTVLPEPKVEKLHVQSKAPLVAPQNWQLEVRVRHRLPDKHIVEFRLSGPNFAESPLGELPSDLTARLADLCRQMTEAYLLSEPSHRTHRLRGIGEALAQWLPPSLHGPLAQGSGALQVVSEDIWLPWELLWVGDNFLGQRYALSRSFQIAPLPPLAGGSGVLVHDPGLSIDDARQSLAPLVGRLVQWSSVSQVLRGLNDPPAGIFYYFGHGDTPAQDPQGSMLHLSDGDLRPTDILKSSKVFKGGLVVLNACEAGVPTFTPLAGATWAQKFLDAGAAAVVVPSWKVEVNAARSFAKTFFKLLNQVSMAEAARLARQKLAGAHLLEQAAYAVYAGPDARWPQAKI